MISLNVNGRDHVVQAPDDMPLLWVLRDLLNLKGTKFGCGIAQCGACTVHINGRPVRSCMLPASNVGSRRVTTIEAIGKTESGRRVQQAWLDLEDADRKIRCPVLSLWGEDFGAVGRLFDMKAIWSEMAENLSVAPIRNCGHLPQEEQPAVVNKLLLDFLRGWNG